MAVHRIARLGPLIILVRWFGCATAPEDDV
jgi:hypothetical protein